jgi:hypothetical protein
MAERPTLRVRIESAVQIVFPIPGEGEINVVVRVLSENPTRFDIAVVAEDLEQLPTIGSEVDVVVYENYYRGNQLNGRPTSTRLCLKKFPQ